MRVLSTSALEPRISRFSPFAEAYFLFTLTFLPLDSVSIFSQYGPLAGYLAAPLGAFVLIGVLKTGDSVPFVVAAIVIFGLYALVLSVVLSVGRSFGGTVDFFLSFGFGLSFFVSAFYLLRSYSFRVSGPSHFLTGVCTALAPGFILALGFGTLEIVDLLLPGAGGPSNFVITQVLGNHDHVGVQWFSNEPSWAGMQMIFAFPVLRYLVTKRRLPKFILLLLIVNIGLSFSLFAWLGTAVFAVGSGMLDPSRRVRWITVGLLFAVALVFAAVGVALIMALPEESTRQVRRLQALFSGGFSQFLRFSASETIRIGFPFSTLLVFLDHPLYGVGAGNTRFFLANYFFEYFPWATRMEEVNAIFAAQSGSWVTPRNLPARLLGETGIIGTLLFGGAVVSQLPRAHQCTQHHQDWRLVVGLVSAVAVATLQFDSFALITMWLTLGIVGVLASFTPLSQPETDPIKREMFYKD